MIKLNEGQIRGKLSKEYVFALYLRAYQCNYTSRLSACATG